MTRFGGVFAAGFPGGHSDTFDLPGGGGQECEVACGQSHALATLPGMLSPDKNDGRLSGIPCLTVDCVFIDRDSTGTCVCLGSLTSAACNRTAGRLLLLLLNLAQQLLTLSEGQRVQPVSTFTSRLARGEVA